MEKPKPDLDAIAWQEGYSNRRELLAHRPEFAETDAPAVAAMGDPGLLPMPQGMAAGGIQVIESQQTTASGETSLRPLNATEREILASLCGRVIETNSREEAFQDFGGVDYVRPMHSRTRFRRGIGRFAPERFDEALDEESSE